MKLKLTKRAGEKKSELTKTRFEGNIPAAVYNSGKPSEKALVSGTEFEAAVRSLPKGYLPTTIFELDFEGKKHKAIVKEIQYHPTTYQVQHLDFLVLDDKRTVDIKVPVIFTGAADCVGVKLGGFVRQILHHVRVRCFPADIPREFKLDIRELEIGQSKRVGDVDLGEAIRPLINEKEIVVVIAKR